MTDVKTRTERIGVLREQRKNYNQAVRTLIDCEIERLEAAQRADGLPPELTKTPEPMILGGDDKPSTSEPSWEGKMVILPTEIVDLITRATQQALIERDRAFLAAKLRSAIAAELSQWDELVMRLRYQLSVADWKRMIANPGSSVWPEDWFDKVAEHTGRPSRPTPPQPEKRA